MNEAKKYAKKIGAFFLVYFVGYFLHFGLFARLAIGAVTPNILLVLTASYGLMNGGIWGMVFGFFSGILVDCFSPDFFGFNCLLFLFVGFFGGIFTKFYFGDNPRFPSLLVGVCDILYGTVIFIFLFLSRGRNDFLFYFLNIIMPEAVYSMIVYFVLYIPLNRLFVWTRYDSSRRVLH